MAIEDDYLDVLQNIEFAIVTIYRAKRQLTDHEVRSAIETLLRDYTAESRGKPSTTIALTGLTRDVFAAVKNMCDLRLGRTKNKRIEDAGIKFDGLTVDELSACLKRIRKSIDKWNKEFGRQGYLDFIDKFL